MGEKIKKYLIFGGIFLMICLISEFFWQKKSQKPSFEEEKKKIFEEEKKKIDEWLSVNNLNEFGDSKETMYTGGTPLFDEATGTLLDRYEYLIKKFPHQPWKDLKK